MQRDTTNSTRFVNVTTCVTVVETQGCRLRGSAFIYVCANVETQRLRPRAKESESGGPHDETKKNEKRKTGWAVC